MEGGLKPSAHYDAPVEPCQEFEKEITPITFVPVVAPNNSSIKPN